jgi:hypothetical protein
MEYEGSIGSSVEKNEKNGDFHVLGLFKAKNLMR